MAHPQNYTALVQSSHQTLAGHDSSLPITTSSVETIHTLPSSYHVLIRVLAVALNPNDHKMLIHFPMARHGLGCDFCGIVQRGGDSGDDPNFVHRPGTRVCGTVFPYAATDTNNIHHRMGAFAEYVVVDSRLLLRVPDQWSDLQAAALGGVGWSTAGLAISSSDALALPGHPSKPAGEKRAILVYGGGTATGTMAIQMLRLSGYAPIAVTQSAESAALAEQFGAVHTVRLTGKNISACLESINKLTKNGSPLRHALDCITDQDSAAVCFGALARTGGRYACLEQFQPAWRTRRVVKVKEVMGYEVLGRAVDLGGPESTYTRGVNQRACQVGQDWAVELQALLNRGSLRVHPIQEVCAEKDPSRNPCAWPRAVISGLETLKAGGVRGQKLVVRISQ